MSSPSPVFRYNPITGQLDLSDDHGSGPGGDVAITADEGGTITASVFSMLGKMAGSAQVMTTLLEGGILNWENRTWETPYVVDTNADPGTRGTFSTIQAALDAAVLDGMTYTNPKKIVLRNAAYVEDLNIPGGAYFFGSCIMGSPSQFILPLSITGNHTFDAIGTFYSNGVYWITPTGTMFTGGGTIGLIQAINSVFNCPGDKFFDVSGTFGIECFYCQFVGNAGDSVQLEFNNIANFFTCDLGSTLCTSTGTIPRFYNCTSIGGCTVNGGAYFAYDSTFASGNAAGPNITQTSGQPMLFDNCNFANNNATYAIDATAEVQVANCYAQTNLGNLIDLLSPTTTSGQVMSTLGNVLKGLRTDTDLILSGSEAYLGVTDTSAARSITLRPSWKDYQVYVVDESGAAGTNNITVDVVGGGLINGAASLVINQNNGAVLFHQINATDFIAISSTISSGGGSITLTPDVGSPITSSSIPVQGKAFNSAKVMETASDTGTLFVANNTWDTAYVVDQNTTYGEKGTFETLQDAIDAIVADGVATTDLAGIIRMRPGVYVYVDPVVIPPNVTIVIKGDTNSGGIGGTNWQYDVYLNANVVNDATSNLYLYDIFIAPDAGDALTSPSGNLYIVNSSIISGTVGGFINLQGSYATLIVDGGSLNAYACNQLAVQLDSGSAYFKQCGDLSIIQNAGQVIVWGATGLTASGSPGAGSSFLAYDVPVSSMITVTPEVFMAGNLTANSAGLQGGGRFFDPSVAVKQIQRLKGNCYVSRITDSNTAITLQDYFIGIQGNSGPVTLTIAATGLTKGCPWQSWRIADLEGTASTNPITISCADGLINNASSYVISKNFGSIEIYFDGTNFFVTSTTSNEEFSEPIGELAYFANKNGDSYLSGLWLKCDGSILLQSSYPTLYSRMGLINEGGINWTARTSGTSSTILAATFGSSKHLIAGNGGVLRSSTDAITWTTRTSGFSATIRSLTFGGGNFIYGGDQGALATSTDGITWNTKNPSLGRISNPNQGTFGPYMAYNAGTFVGVCGDNGYVLTSTDGITWTTRDNNLNATPANGAALAYGAGVFCAVFGSGLISTSTDGITWTARTSGTTTTFTSLSYINSLFLAGCGQFAFTSTDGITWSNVSTGIGSGNAANCAVYAFGAYYYWTGAGARTSTDLVTWTNILGSSGNANAAAFNGTNIVIGLNAGVIRTSTNGSVWTAQTSQTTSTITALIYNGSNLHVYGTSNGGIGTSTDGITWVARTSGTTSTIQGLLYDGSLYHASVLHGTLTSTDAITWTTNTGYSGTTSSILSTAYGNSTYLYGTVGGRVATSPDTTTWTPQTSGTTSNVNALRYGTVFVYATAGGGLSTSTDGVTWTARTSGTTSDINTLTYGALYVYAGVGGVLASSTDAITWTTRTSGTTSNLNTLRYANDFYIAAGVNGVTIQSNGAVTWYSRVSTTTSTIFASSTGAGVFVESGSVGVVQSAPNDYPYDRTTQFQLPTDNSLLITTEAATNFFRSLYIKALN